MTTQTVIVQGLAIEHAQQEIEQLKARVAQGPQSSAPGQQPSSPGFLPRGVGMATATAAEFSESSRNAASARLHSGCGAVGSLGGIGGSGMRVI